MENTVYLSVASLISSSDNVVEVPLETLLVFSVYKFCKPASVRLCFVSDTDQFEENEIFLRVKTDDTTLEQSAMMHVPWQVASCVFPAVMFGDTIITGLCAVVRHICKFRTTNRDPEEHQEGLLGFKKTCLQAPNESSVWTKFCEVDIVKTLKRLFKKPEALLPDHVVRFEGHLKKPVKIHNIFKVAQNLQNSDVNSSSTTVLSHEENNDIVNEISSNLAKVDLNCVERKCKNRKWKSQKQVMSTNIPKEDLNLEHMYAEGPFFTLADLLMYPCFKILQHFYRKKIVETHLPLITKWLDNVEKIESVKPITSFMQNTLQINSHIKNTDVMEVKLPQIDGFSLYKHDAKRHNPKKRIYTKERDIEAALTGVKVITKASKNDIMLTSHIDWNKIPNGANPHAGHLPDKRMARKTEQLENLALAVMQLAKENDIIVDFCSGSGHLGILLAHLLPKCTIILLENKEKSLLRARDRVHEMGLTNVYFFQCNLDFFIGKFDIGVALHACGIATDLVFDKCLQSNARFVICPCCYGSLHTTDRLKYPRSQAFSDLDVDKYICIGHAADQTHTDHPMEARGAECMAIIDTDRAKFAEEHGYNVSLKRLHPLSCTPKNNLLIGIPS